MKLSYAREVIALTAINRARIGKPEMPRDEQDKLARETYRLGDEKAIDAIEGGFYRWERR